MNIDFAMPSLSFNAAAQRISLLLGMVDTNNVIAWADTEIEAGGIPPNALIEVSMGRAMTRGAMAERLSELISNPNDTRPLQHVLKIVADQVRGNVLDTKTAILNIYNYLRAENLLYHDPFILFCNLEDDLALVRDGILSEERISDLRIDLLDALDEIANQGMNAG